VVPDLQQLGLEASRVGVEEPALGGALRVSDEQRYAFSECDAKHEGGVVRAAVGLDARARGQHGDFGAPVATRSSAQLGRSADGDPAPRQPFEEGSELARPCVPVGEPALPQLAYLDLVERARKAEVMVGVRVRQDHHVDSRAPPRGELGHEDSTTHVDSADLSAPVDQHEPPVGQIDEQRIALTNIKSGHPELPRRSASVLRDDLCRDERADPDDGDASASAWGPPEGEGHERDDHELERRRRR